MDLADIAGWVAPAATMVAATMTAANLGARITGWGFVVFAVGSVAWTIVAIATQQGNLLWTNAFLLLVNVVGVWRWLGRQARYADGAETATDVSARSASATLLPVSGLPGRTVLGRDGDVVATIVEAMVASDGGGLAYVVISEGGVAGVGERLHALATESITLRADAVTTPLNAAEIAALPVLEDDAWPARAADPRIGRGGQAG